MKNYYKEAVFLFLFSAFVQIVCAQTLSPNKSPQKAIALVLKFTGSKGIPARIELYSKHVFEGRVKKIRSTSAAQFTEPVHVKFFNEQDQLIYEEFAQNPLKQKMESFEQEGSIHRHVVETDSGYLNFRFGIDQNLKSIKVVCFTMNKGKEIIFPTLNVSIP